MITRLDIDLMAIDRRTIGGPRALGQLAGRVYIWANKSDDGARRNALNGVADCLARLSDAVAELERLDSAQ